MDLFSDILRIINFDAELSNGALDLRVPQQQLNGTEVPSPAVDQRSFGPPD